jgi:sterol carrier protein 2
MKDSVVVAGVNMVPFKKPGASDPYTVMGANAVRGALKDAGLEYSDVQQAYVGYVFGDSTSGQRALYEVGMSGIPVINVNNNCSSGSTALYLARQAVESGAVDCALAMGFEEMKPGAIQNVWNDRPGTFDKFKEALERLGHTYSESFAAPCMFGAAGMEYLEKYDAKPEIFAEVAVKTRGHAINNPYSLFNKHITVEQVMAEKVIYEPFLTRFMACPPTSGAAAALICSPEYARKKDLDTTVRIIAQSLRTDTTDTYDSALNVVGQSMGRQAGQEVFEQSGYGPEDIDVIELHDCFTPNEVITYEALGLCGEGEATAFIKDKRNTYGGDVVVNPSGGLMSKGHPIGATGLAQCTELTWHLRGQAGKRQVEGAKIGLQHNLGIGGACVVTMYQAES